MPRSVATVVENSFVKGLITEATGLQYPENSVVETNDCIFDVLGSVQRRSGFDYEYGYNLVPIDKSGLAINTYQWKNATGDGLSSFLVVQIGTILRFFASSDGSTSLSSNLYNSTVDLGEYATLLSQNAIQDETDEVIRDEDNSIIVETEQVLGQYECQFTDGLGKLYVVHPLMDNIYIKYDASTASFIATRYDLQIRDFEGVSDGLAVDTRPTTLTEAHKYNLYNQGWDDTKIATFHTAASAYPSNADVWWIYKDLTDVFNPASTLANNSRGNTAASPAHFILSVYSGDRSTASGVAVNSTSSGSARTSAVAFFAGRVFYTGIAASGFNSKIYFSQIIQKDTQVGNCYQACDPTNETLFDLLPDDGGVLSIPDAGTIYRLVPVQNNLLVFAYRGVFQISGSTGLGFTATDYVISRLSTIRTVSASSFVDTNGLPIFWNTDGIWSVQPTKDGSGLQVVSISRSTIQTFYDAIPTGSKQYARGYFNPLTQVVSWIYSSVDPSTPDSQHTFDRVLNFNVLSGGFYPWTISPGVSVHGIAVIDGTGGISVEEQVITEVPEDVIDDAGNFITAYALTNLSVAPKTKFLVSIPAGSTYNFTFAEAVDPAFQDWTTPGITTVYESYFITGYKLSGQADKNYQANYVTIYNEGTGVFYIQGVWDFSVLTSNGRFTNPQLCQFEDDQVSNTGKRLKMRGQGKSLQYRISSHTSNDFNVIGWSAWETTNASV